MTSSISSQSMIMTTAMAVSGVVLLLSLCRIRNLPDTHHDSRSDSQSSNHISSHPLRSCLSSDGTRREKNKKKRVKFADNVKDERRETSDDDEKKKNRELWNEQVPQFRRMPSNRVALYHGILRDRVHRIEYSY